MGANLAVEALFLPVAFPVFLLIRLIRRWFVIRIGRIIPHRLGHLALNVELYLCEQDAGINVPDRPYLDLWYFAGGLPRNEQLATMWKRHLWTVPSPLLAPLHYLNEFFGGGALHEIGVNTQIDRDVLNLLSATPPHLSFNRDEHARGAAGLRRLGVPDGARFVCLIVRDDAFLQAQDPDGDYRYHDYRNADIRNFELAAQALADSGLYVIRVGAVVSAPFTSSHPRVIDYATHSVRSDFMDVYLGAHCFFCLSTSTGFDAVPMIFRRPVAFAGMVPIGYACTFLKDSVFISKRHWLDAEQRDLTLREVLSHGVAFCTHSDDYRRQGVTMLANTPEEIRDLAVEMTERLLGSWSPEADDDALQARFWEIYPIDALGYSGRRLHGAVQARYGAQFLRNNPEWLA